MEFKLPELGEGVHEGELIKWLIQPGDNIKFDQILCEIMTDKATIEIPSPLEGKVLSLLAKAGQTIHVGQTLLLLESSEKKNIDSTISSAPPSPVIQAPLSLSASTILASPYTRKKARELGIDLQTISGSGENGRVLLEDLEKKPAASSSNFDRITFSGLRKRIAQKMRTSKDHAAHFTYVEEANLTELVHLRTQAKSLAQQQGIKLTYLPFIMKAMVLALKNFPLLNSRLDEDNQEIILYPYCNIGLSVQTEDGLIAPVIKHVEKKSIFEIAQDIERLVEKARSKKLELSDLSDGTITLTNIGSIGGLFSTPIINYPEVAILGFNKIFRKPIVHNIQNEEKIIIADMSYFSISLDHRVVDGAIAAQFMKNFISMIEKPFQIVLT